MLLDQDIYLRRRQTSITEHTDLISNDVPLSWYSSWFKLFSQECSHGNNPISHKLEFSQPSLLPYGIIEDTSSDIGRVTGWTTVGQSDDDLYLTQDVLCILLARCDEVEGSTTFSIHAHILGETLSHYGLEPHLYEFTDSPGILLYISTGITLVCRIK